MVQLPVNIAGFADLEDLSSYNEKRYYITKRESELFEQVSKMHKVSLALMEKQIPYLNATLLYGESGVGKTAFSRYTAYKLGLPYLYINFSRLVESYLGNTSKNISYLFDFIKKNQCLVMFDEIDCIAASRRYGGGAESELARSTTTLIQLLDGISNDHVIFAATNLHDAIEAKEGVPIQQATATIATTTYQNFFRKYDKFSGMTGTAYTEKKEFKHTYGLDTVVIPTNKPVIRVDRPDVIYITKEGKYKGVVEEVKKTRIKAR